MHRSSLFDQLIATDVFDIAIVGGGATGLGIALDASLRGYKVVLLEAQDFAKGTSSRSTKLVHGGVRYLAQGHVSLVRESLHERAVLLRNAPHIAQPLPFVIPTFKWWERAMYGLGLKLYDALAGNAGIGATHLLSASQVQALLPQVKASGLRGGIAYWDGQFDDARLAIELARTAQSKGALLLNYCPVQSITHGGNQISGLTCQDTETDRIFSVQAKCVVNATGVWVDTIRKMDAQTSGLTIQPLVTPSQGIHLVVDRSFLNQDIAMLIPSTRDGRVLFAIPWLGKVILGTTDTARADVPLEPLAFDDEVQFILQESARYLTKAPTAADVLSVWAGLRPLVHNSHASLRSTKQISREHTVVHSESGLVTVTGGKWTTYRAMAQDVLSHCVHAGLIPPTPHAVSTADVPLIGAPDASIQLPSLMHAQGVHSYGTEQVLLKNLPGADVWLCDGLSEAMVRFAVRFEFARTVEDVLARRVRLLFLDARLASKQSEQVAAILMSENIKNPQLEAFRALARSYLLSARP